MRIRRLEARDHARWNALRAALWKDEPAEALAAEGQAALAASPPLVVFVAEVEGAVVGFLDLGLRSVAEGCDGSPVPYVEGWYVEAAQQGRGVGRALVRAAEDWSRASGFTELASDTWVANAHGRAAHLAVGFREVETIVTFRKVL